KGGVKVGTIKPLAAYTGQKFFLSGISGADAASFHFDTTKGTITATSALDFETKSSYTFQVTVADSLDHTKTTTANVVVNVKNLNEAPVYTLLDGTGTTVAQLKGKASLTIDENVPGGTTQNGLLVGTLTAADQDQLASTLHYQKDTKGNTVIYDKTGAFAYDASTGQITVADAS